MSCMLYNTDIDNSMVLARGKGGEVGRGGQDGGEMGQKETLLSLGNGHTMV